MQLLQHLLELRFLEGRWQQLESETHKLVILQTLRILSRDRQLQRRFLLRGVITSMCLALLSVKSLLTCFRYDRVARSLSTSLTIRVLVILRSPSALARRCVE